MSRYVDILVQTSIFLSRQKLVSGDLIFDAPLETYHIIRSTQGASLRTTILWRQAAQPNPSGFLVHRFELAGPEAILIQVWLSQDNKSHGEWRLTPWGSGKFEIWAKYKNAASLRQVESHIARLKAAWGAPEYPVDWEHRAPNDGTVALGREGKRMRLRPRGRAVAQRCSEDARERVEPDRDTSTTVIG